MKIIFSRKGVDSAAGECASAIVDGRPFSLPIPTSMPTPTCYGDLAEPMSTIASDLSGGRLSPNRSCHLDPDIDQAALKASRPPGWRGALGQVSAALSHLRNAEVGPGDLFLFWGLYRQSARTTAGWHYIGPKQHGIFGWLQVDDVVDLRSDGLHALARYPWLESHPHVRPGWTGPNTVFIAREVLSMGDGTTPGFGVFDRLIPLSSDKSGIPSVWSVPAWLDPSFGGVGMTYHPRERWLGDGRLTAAARGQEFIADAGDRADALDWVISLFRGRRHVGLDICDYP